MLTCIHIIGHEYFIIIYSSFQHQRVISLHPLNLHDHRLQVLLKLHMRFLMMLVNQLKLYMMFQMMLAKLLKLHKIFQMMLMSHLSHQYLNEWYVWKLMKCIHSNHVVRYTVRCTYPIVYVGVTKCMLSMVKYYLCT